MCQKEIKTSMGKMKNKVLPVSVLVLFMLMCINACGISKSRDSADMVSELNNRIIEKLEYAINNPQRNRKYTILLFFKKASPKSFYNPYGCDNNRNI